MNEFYMGISLLKKYFETANTLIIDALLKNDMNALESIILNLDIELSKFIIASEGELKITYDDEYMNERENPINYTSIFYSLYSVNYLFKGITSIFFDLFYAFLKRDGVLV